MTAHMNRAAAIAARTTRIEPAVDREQDLELLAWDEARRADDWADGLTPAEYQLALVDRAQARQQGRDPDGGEG